MRKRWPGRMKMSVSPDQGPMRPGAVAAALDVLVRFDDDNRREYGYSAVDLELIYP